MIKIKDKTKCCGCAACANICIRECIKMVEDEEGFLYPQVHTDECVGCNACEGVCPIINHVEKKDNSAQIAIIVQHKDKDICKQSTAGGAFTAIAEYVINQGGVTFGVEMQSDYSIRHGSAEKKEELFKFRNSKYVQSAIGNAYLQARKQLNNGRLVCFSGTPCQIEGLRHYLNKDYENLILVDVVCRAVPSPKIWRNYMEMETEKHGSMQSIRFRDKTLGYQYTTMEMINEQGHIYRGGIESQPWLRMFFSGMTIRPSCTDCKFRSRYRDSDFTIWDCFNVCSFDKSFDEDIGTTRVLIHTEKGRRIFESVKINLKYKELSADLAVADVNEMIASPQKNILREKFFDDYRTMPMDDLIKKYFPDSLTVTLKKYSRLMLNKFKGDKLLKHILRK